MHILKDYGIQATIGGIASCVLYWHTADNRKVINKPTGEAVLQIAGGMQTLVAPMITVLTSKLLSTSRFNFHLIQQNKLIASHLVSLSVTLGLFYLWARMKSKEIDETIQWQQAVFCIMLPTALTQSYVALAKKA
jgi:hypothetical protein